MVIKIIWLLTPKVNSVRRGVILKQRIISENNRPFYFLRGAL